jgi:hypothetical protein
MPVDLAHNFINFIFCATIYEHMKDLGMTVEKLYS